VSAADAASRKSNTVAYATRITGHVASLFAAAERAAAERAMARSTAVRAFDSTGSLRSNGKPLSVTLVMPPSRLRSARTTSVADCASAGV